LACHACAAGVRPLCGPAHGCKKMRWWHWGRRRLLLQSLKLVASRPATRSAGASARTVPELPRLLRAPGSGLAATRGRLAGENQGCACTRGVSALACLRTVAQVWPGRSKKAAHRGSVARLQWACAGSLLSAVYAGLCLGRARGHRCACGAGILVKSISVLHEKPESSRGRAASCAAAPTCVSSI